MSGRSAREARRAAKAAMKARRAAVKAKLAEARAARRGQGAERRRLRRKLLLLALLLLLLLRRCECDEPVVGVVEPDAAVDAGGVAADMGVDAAGVKVEKRAGKAPIRAKLPKQERPTYRNPTPPPADWLAALRIQVAARGPRLARCFEGTERPGALQWTAVVDVARGVVSDHGFEPVLGGAQLSKGLERCLTGVLAVPGYRLPAVEGVGRPRVSIIVEF